MGCESGGQRVQIATETGDLAADLKTWAGLSAIVLHPVRGRPDAAPTLMARTGARLSLRVDTAPTSRVPENWRMC